MNFLKTVIQLPFVKSFVLGQGRVALAGLAAWLFSHGLGAGYSQDQLLGAFCAILAVAFQAADNLVVDGKITTALNTPVPTPAQGANQ